MKLFNAIAAGAVIGASLISVKPAAAATSYCYETTNDASVCILSVRNHKRYGANQKLVKYSINASVDQSVVNCRTANRSNYKDNLWGIACYEFN